MSESRSDPQAGAGYLTVNALLRDGRELQVFPGFATPEPHRVEEVPDSPIEVELLGERGEALARYRLPAVRPCQDERPTDDLLVMGKVPFAEGARTLRILYNGETVGEQSIAASAPEVRMNPLPDATSGGQEVSWTARHQDGLPLWSLLAFSNDDSQTWSPVSMVTDQQSVIVQFDDLPGGTACRFRVHVSDGANTAIATSEPFRLPPRPCRALILAPVDGETFVAGSAVALSGQGWWLEEQVPETERLTWQSSLDGDLGFGGLLSVQLSPGRHTLTLTAGSGDRAGTDSVTVTIEEAATA